MSRWSRVSAGLAALAALAPSCSGVDPVHGAHTCAIVDGGVLCWGFNHHGQVGDGSAYGRLTPVAAVGLASGVRALAAGDRFTCAIRGDASVACWGRNKRGQLGDGTTERRWTPTPTLPLPAPARAVAAGGLHACALLEGGEIHCWGANEHAQLADGSRADRASPAPASVPPAIDVAAGDRHACALLQGGAVTCWGGNRFHEVSAADSEDEPVPAAVALGEPAVSIAAGGHSTCAALASGGVSCWGGSMGASPAAIRAVSDVVAIDVGNAGGCALDARGAVSCWSAPGDAKTVPGLAGAVAVSVGFWHSCAVSRTAPSAAGARATRASWATARGTRATCRCPSRGSPRERPRSRPARAGTDITSGAAAATRASDSQRHAVPVIPQRPCRRCECDVRRLAAPLAGGELSPRAPHLERYLKWAAGIRWSCPAACAPLPLP